MKNSGTDIQSFLDKIDLSVKLDLAANGGVHTFSDVGVLSPNRLLAYALLDGERVPLYQGSFGFGDYINVYFRPRTGEYLYGNSGDRFYKDTYYYISTSWLDTKAFVKKHITERLNDLGYATRNQRPAVL